MMMLSQAQQVSYELSSVSADHPVPMDVPESFADDQELDAEWLSAQLGGSVGCSHRIVRHLASGGMGHVFVAEHEYLGARACVKVPRYADATGRTIIEAEAKLLAKLEHPNIVRALDVGQLADGRVYLLMEYALGVELGGWLDAYGAMSFQRCLAVIRQIASAVDYLHLKGVVHGDLKPANLLIDTNANDFVKLVDFGIASATARDDRRGVLGTPEYMAPEQARGDAWGPLSDVYAVAALALQMLTGHQPYAHRSAQDVMTAVLTEAAPTPSALGLVVPKLDAVFSKGLHRDPAQRYPRASAFVNALAEVLEPSCALAPAAAGCHEQTEQTAAPRHSEVRVAAVPVLEQPLNAAAVRGRPWRLGPLWDERILRRLAACVVAAVFVFSVYG